jgi:hypothetical protein
VFYLLLTLLFAVPAFAQNDDHAQMAEYERIGQEMTTLAARNAWDGVERSYASLLETGIPLTAEQHYYGAQAAANRGDVAEARDRAMKALEVEDDQTYRDWVHRIDQNYGPVSLMGDPGKVALTIEQMPFEPYQSAAVQFARHQVEETGTFEGLLPAGNYQFGPMSLKVRPGVHTERIDIRTDKYMRKLERQEKHDDKDTG